jgi:hypothetical protein
MLENNLNFGPILEKFNSFNLKELESMNLLNRFDTKFILKSQELNSILERLKEDYQILEINGIRNFRYYNIYFDTKDFMLYTQHHNGKTHRSKVRYRHYLDADKCFFEIKTKTSTSYTVKNRIREAKIDKKIENSAAELLIDTLSIQPDQLFPKLVDTYNRITLICKKQEEKITIDTNIFFQNTINSKEIPNIAFIEIKQKRYNYNSPAFLALREMNIKHQNKVSKYCLGMVLTNTVNKYNFFKPTVLKLNKSMREENGFQLHEFFDN